MHTCISVNKTAFAKTDQCEPVLGDTGLFVAIDELLEDMNLTGAAARQSFT